MNVTFKSSYCLLIYSNYLRYICFESINQRKAKERERPVLSSCDNITHAHGSTNISN